MKDTLMEQIIKTVECAVEERAALFGPHYASSLEGYGDIHRQMVGVMASLKELKSAASDMVAYVNSADSGELLKALDKLDAKSKLVSYEAMRMCETVARYKRTIRDHMGGDLLDILDGMADPDAEESNEEE